MYSVKTRTRAGAPTKALAYIGDGSDERIEPGYSDGELAYIARMGEGWKTDQEGGHIPLVGLGVLEGQPDGHELCHRFDDACIARHDRRAVTGYKSYTFTLPKEVSLFAEGHREKTQEAIYAALKPTLDKIFADKDYYAVAALHTRNAAGEIHYHAHVLVAKFAQERATGRTVSLNGARAGNTGRAQVAALKSAWTHSSVRRNLSRADCGPAESTLLTSTPSWCTCSTARATDETEAD